MVANEFVEDWLAVDYDENLDADFVIEAQGNSMKEYGIIDGAYCFIRKQTSFETGDILLLSIEDNGDCHPVLKKAKFIRGFPCFCNGRNEPISDEDTENARVVRKVIKVEMKFK